MKLTGADRRRLDEIKSNRESMDGFGLERAVEWLIRLIDRLAQEPDGPDVVFCEDCVRFKDGECNSAYGLPDPVDETDFCSYGERIDADAPERAGRI